MKPYAVNKLSDERRICNYRLSRLRRVAENAFGILVNRFRLWIERCNLSPYKACTLLLAFLVLRNMLCAKSHNSYLPPGFTDSILDSGEILEGSWRACGAQNCLTPITRTHMRRYTASATKIRDRFARYFVTDGSVPWQWKCLL